MIIFPFAITLCDICLMPFKMVRYWFCVSDSQKQYGIVHCNVVCYSCASQDNVPLVSRPPK